MNEKSTTAQQKRIGNSGIRVSWIVQISVESPILPDRPFDVKSATTHRLNRWALC